MNYQDKALFVRLATDDGRDLSPLHQILVGMLLTDGLPPPSDNALAELDELYAEVSENRYEYAWLQLWRDPALVTADAVVEDWCNTMMEAAEKRGEYVFTADDYLVF